ncbi:E3 ubiquitin-protein ligase MARCH5-like [Sarcoptes scabiei]|nr:E3 ubiquitin-protein ligase MARCH5-like [Sarcoptes scabiei]
MFIDSMQFRRICYIFVCFVCSSIIEAIDVNYHYENHQNNKDGFGGSTGGDMSLWIDEMQVKQFFNGFPMKIHAILDGVVLPYVLDPNFEKYLPVIPSQVTSVNFTWKSGENRNYYYDFDQLQSFDMNILKKPILSIESKGLVPKKPKIFQVLIPCVGNMSGVASFTLGLRIIDIETNQHLAGTPIRLKLQKQCTYHGPDPECDKKCGNGKCNNEKICVCPTGFLGKYCESALCYPQCQNGGTCIAPGVCACSPGFQGLHCEVNFFSIFISSIDHCFLPFYLCDRKGGICSQKCLNGGKCIQKDSCLCRRGYYGPRCEYSKCSIPCLNSGKCVGVNRCRCRKGFTGFQCQTKTNRSHFSSSSSKHPRNRKRKSKKKFV